MIYEEIVEALNQLLALHPKPDAPLTASDRLSTMTVRILSKLKIKVPEK